MKACVQQPNETEALAYGCTRGIGKCVDRGFRLRVYRAPHRGVPWGFLSSLLSSMDASRQLSLSPHFPAFLPSESM